MAACITGAERRPSSLRSRGARLDLEGAAGVGRLDVVKSFFNDDGSLKPPATQQQMKDGFAWACEFGRTSVVDFLLQRGMDVDAKLKHDGQTGLHWAAYGGHADTVKLLLERGAPVDAKDESYGGTPWGGRCTPGVIPRSQPKFDDRIRRTLLRSGRAAGPGRRKAGPAVV